MLRISAIIIVFLFFVSASQLQARNLPAASLESPGIASGIESVHPERFENTMYGTSSRAEGEKLSHHTHNIGTSDIPAGLSHAASSSGEYDYFILIADPHIDADKNRYRGEWNMYDNLEEAVHRILNNNRFEKPDAVIILGDIANHRGSLAEYQNVRELLGQLPPAGIPVYYAMGNHDNHTNFYAVFPENVPSPDWVPGRHVRIIETPTSYFFILDTLRPGTTYTTGGILGEEQREWLDAALHLYSDKPVLLMGHHYPWHNLTDGVIRGLEDYQELLDIAHNHSHVKAYIFGHSHRMRFLMDDDLHLFNVPPTCGAGSGHPTGFIHTFFYPDRMAIEVETFDPNESWDGHTASLSYRETEGEPGPVITLSDWNDLNDIRDNLFGNYILTTHLNEHTAGYSTYNTGSGWIPIQNFAGILDGNGYTISGLTSSEGGLFESTYGAVIKNLGLIDVDISATVTSVGALAGVLENKTSLISCFSTGTLSGTGRYGYGGLAGRINTGSSIDQSWSSVNVNHNASNGGRTGGLVGQIHGTEELPGRVTDSFAMGNVTTTGSQAGGLTGVVWSQGNVLQSYSTGSVSGGANTGGLTGQNSGSVVSSFWDTQTSGTTSSEGGTGRTTSQMKTTTTFTAAGWDFTEIWFRDGAVNLGYPFLRNSPDATNPVQISNWTQLNTIKSNPTNDYVLVNDLHSESPDYSGIGDSWIPIQNFSGTLDGDGHTISGLISSVGGLFESTSGARIENLGLLEAVISGTTDNLGVLADEITNYSQIISCYSTGTLTGTGRSSHGGLAGRVDSHSSIEKSWSGVNVSVPRSGTDARWTGGLAGYLREGTITDSYARGSVTSTGVQVGGLVGRMDANDTQTGTVIRSYSTGSVSGNSLTGGLVGRLFAGGSVENSFWDTQTSGTTSSDGGTGKTTADMKIAATFTAAGWDFSEVWDMEGSINNGYPFLKTEHAPDPDPDPDPNRIAEIPYMENFSDVTVPALPAGWGSIGDVVTFDGWTAIGGTTLEFPLGIASDDYRIAVFPKIEASIDISTLKLKFNVQTPSIIGDERIEVGFLTNPSNPSTFTLIESVSLLPDAAVLDAEAGLAGYQESDGRYLALKAESPSDWNRFFIGYVELEEGTPVVSTEKEQGIPDQLELAQNYPNPFNPSTIISYGLPEEAHVRITIYDIMGRQVARLVDETRESGRYNVTWDASRLAGGVYMYHLQAGNKSLVRRMTLIK